MREREGGGQRKIWRQKPAVCQQRQRKVWRCLLLAFRRGSEPRNAAATARRFSGACQATEHDLAVTFVRSTEPVRASDPQNWTAVCGRWVRL